MRVDDNPRSSWRDNAELAAEAKRLEEEEAAANPARPIVQVVGGQLPKTIDAAEGVITKLDVEIYQSGDYPVYIGSEAPPKNLYTPYRRRAMFRYEAAHLADHWTRFVDFQKFDAKAKKWRSIDCPPQVAAAYIQRRGRDVTP